jgi:isopentenyldiphosphate isomerase
MINSQELIFAVDSEDNPIAPIPRSQAHADGIWHRISHVWVLNNKKQILCQKRSITKDTNPGKWEAFFGGHVGPSETYEEAAVKEANEELGLSFTQKDMHFFTKAKNEDSHHFQAAYYVMWNGSVQDLHIEKEEVQQVAWKDLADVENVLLLQKSPDWVHVVYEKEIINKFK